VLPRLVALRPLGLGDLLTGIPALRALAAFFANHERVLACPAGLAPLALASGAVDRVVDTRPLDSLAGELHAADVAVDLHGKGPASHRVLLASRPRRLIAFANEAVRESAGLPEWRDDEHEVVRWCRMLAAQGIPADPRDLYIDPPPAVVPKEAVGATIVHPGAAYPARRWPPQRFAAVARAELCRGRTVIYTGTRDERHLAEEVARLASGGRVVAGATDLRALAALVAVAARLVSGDTGVAHLATALGTPSVVLFGPTAPARWGPPAGDRRHRALWAGHVGNPHGPEPDPGLLAIDPETVLAALADLDAERAAA
jgi:ADP-heptose:LPS heptosyltransferase